MKEFNITLGIMEALKVQPFEIVSQDINGNKLNITLVRDGSLQPYLLTGTTVILYFKREDDIRYQQYATITNATQGQIEIILDADIIANRGKVFAEVAIYEGEEMKCTSQLFAFLVRKNINDGETHVSGNDLPNYRKEMQRLETILDNLIISAGDSNPEIVAARYSLLEGVTFTTLGDRLDFIESKIQTHIDAEIEDGAVHGIRVNEGELEFLLNGEWKKVSGMEVHDNDMHNPAFATASDLTTHLAETMSHTVLASRDLSLTGTQVISLPFNPKLVFIEAVVPSSFKFSHGIVSQNMQTCIHSLNDVKEIRKDDFRGVTINNTFNPSNATRGNVSLGENELSINWSHLGTGATGILEMQITLVRHGEVV